MGTNFYTLKGVHIGKRSAAGLYCWNCDVSLCKRGKDFVHHSSGFKITANTNFRQFIEAEKTLFYDQCPKCGKEPLKETWDNNSAGRELGFNNLLPHRKTGVQSCSSFRWAIQPADLGYRVKIVDEYERKYTNREFREILKECPIQFYDSIGIEFF